MRKIDTSHIYKRKPDGRQHFVGTFDGYKGVYWFSIGYEINMLSIDRHKMDENTMAEFDRLVTDLFDPDILSGLQRDAKSISYQNAEIDSLLTLLINSNNHFVSG
jgi:hypothetical protein